MMETVVNVNQFQLKGIFLEQKGYVTHRVDVRALIVQTLQ